MMKNTVQFFLASAILIPVVASGGVVSSDLDLKAVEAKLRQQMMGKVAVLRSFYKSSDLTFDPQGNVIGDNKTGPWTYFGRIEVASVSLTLDSLVIKGSRNVVKWELSASEFQNYTLEDKPVRIAIHLEPGFTEGALAFAIGNVFLTRGMFLSDVVPEFWKDILTTDRARRAQWDEKKNAVMKTVFAMSSKTSAPRLLSKAEGIDVSPSPFKVFTANNLLLSFVVGADGTVEQLQIDKPVGLGLDDPVAETISNWKWSPAMRGDTPVAVVMYARVLFQAEKGHIDPYHTNPCYNLPNVMQC